MSVGIGRISKGLFQRSIENVVNNGEELRRAFLAALQKDSATSSEDWIDFLREYGGLDRAAESYIRNAWLRFWESEPLSYSPDMVKEILRQSLIQAIALADQHKSDPKNPLPIDCHWIWTDHNDKLEVLITYNRQQVTRILLTPPPPTEPPLPLRFRSDYFIVKRGPIEPALELPLGLEQPGTSEPRAYARDPQVVTVQLKSVR
jgi:hypothetical protein